MKLPKGIETLEDFILIDALLHDKTFIESVESTEGKVSKIYADWRNNVIVYEFKNGSVKESPLKPVLEIIKKLEYRPHAIL